MARQFAQRFRVNRWFDDINRMFEEAKPDVVHITTPPSSHFQLARLCLERGVHVYVEKPFTLVAPEAEELIALAERKDLKITAGHDDQFSHAARRMRELVSGGYLGGPPVHMESYFCYGMEGSNPYAKALLGDKRHWVRQLPGQLLQNIISHGIARIAEFVTTDTPEVIACGFVSPALRNLGEMELVDELRVIICEEKRATAYFTFSTQMRPVLHQFRIYGPANGLLLDQDNETVIKLRGARYKSYLEQFVPPLSFAKQYIGNASRNLRTFLRSDFHPKSGMKCLIESFYRSIREDIPPPLSYDQILRTSRIMDAIFVQVRGRGGPHPPAPAYEQ
jgi:predicted dehydrogenase